jgi:Spy/CpxP family protein refolding chaperone
MKATRILTFAATALLSTSLVFAQGFGGPGGHGGDFHGGGMGSSFRGGPGGGTWWKNTELATKIGLTADQTKRMDDIVQSSRIELIHIKATLEEEQVLLEPMMNANPPDTAKTLAQIGKIADTRATLEKANAKMLLSIRGVLTADQWTKLQAERHARHNMPSRDSRGGTGGGPDRRGPGGPGGRGRGPATPGSGSAPATPPAPAE